MRIQKVRLQQNVGGTYTLVVNDDHFLIATIPAELIVEIMFRCANTQTEYPQHVAWIGGLENRSISDPGACHLCSLRWGCERDALMASKRGCRMLDVCGCGNGTSEG